MSSLWSAWKGFWFRPVSPSSIAVFRIGFGLLSLLNTLLYVPDFLVWFGREGAASIASVVSYQPTLVARALLWAMPGDGVYLLLLMLEGLASLAVIAGLSTRSSLLVLNISRLVLYHRNPLLWHQVDILLRYYGWILLVCPSGELLSVDARGNSPRRFAPWGQRLIQVKLSFIYLEAFLGKMAGPLWRDGSAVYYATHFADGARYPVPGFMDHLWVYQALTYFTLAIELSLFTLVWFPRWRNPVLIAGVVFHVGLHVFLNLDLLEAGVMLAYLCHVDPGDMDRFLAAVRARWRRS